MGSGADRVGRIEFANNCKCIGQQIHGCYPYQPCDRYQRWKQERDLLDTLRHDSLNRGEDWG